MVGRLLGLLAVAGLWLSAVAGQQVILPTAPISPSVWPQPYELTLDFTQPNGGPTLYVDPDDFVVTWDANCADRDPLRTQANIVQEKLFPITNKPQQDDSLGRLTGLFIRVDCPQCPFSIDDSQATSTETYNLTIAHGSDGSAVAQLYAPTAWGAIWGIETFSQLLTFAGGNYLLYNSSVKIYDVPRFQYRGVLLDTSHHFIPLHSLRRILDGLSANKLNVLHWQHRSAVATSIASDVFPELTAAPANGGEGGSFDEQQATYTQDQVFFIVSYAKNRGIHVVIENGGLEQAASIGVSHPELTACPEVLASGWPLNEAVSLDPLNNATLDFLAAYWHELDQSSTDYVHLGGDLIDYDACWSSNVRIQAEVAAGKSYEQIQGEFIQNVWTGPMARTAPAAAADPDSPTIFPLFTNNQSMMYRATSDSWPAAFPPSTFNATGWHDILIEAKDQQTLQTVAAEGFDVIFSGDDWDLASATTQAKNAVDGLTDTFDDWATIYAVDIMDGITAATAPYVIGGQVQMFTYQQDDSSVESMLWPRGSAAAERLWSSSNVTSVAPDAGTLNRLQSFVCLLQRRGHRASPLRPGFCSTNTRVRSSSSNTVTVSWVLFGFMIAFSSIGALYCLAVLLRTVSHLRAGTKAAVTASLNAPLMEH